MTEPLVMPWSVGDRTDGRHRRTCIVCGRRVGVGILFRRQTRPRNRVGQIVSGEIERVVCNECVAALTEAKNRPTRRATHWVSVMPGLIDRGPCETRPFYEGDVFELESHGKTRIARVLGPTLETMRTRKREVARALRALENSER